MSSRPISLIVQSERRSTGKWMEEENHVRKQGAKTNQIRRIRQNPHFRNLLRIKGLTRILPRSNTFY